MSDTADRAGGRGPGRRALAAGATAVAAAAVAVPVAVRARRAGDGDGPGTAAVPPSPAARRGPRPRSDRRPDILLVLTDDQPEETDRALRRTLDRLGRDGVTFGRAHADTPLCAPSRASVMPGRYARHHGVLDTRHPCHLDQRTTVQRHLRNAGHRTGLLAEW